MKNKVTLINMMTGLLLQVCLIVNGLIIPRMILTCFGSEMNGLVSSAEQFLKLFYLAEGGVTMVVSANLYGPLVERDSRKISSVLAAAKAFYGKLGCFFVIYSVILAIVYPIAAGLDFVLASSVILILSLMQLMRYYLSLTFQVLLAADKKQYLVSLVQSAITVSGVVLAFLAVRLRQDIRLLLFMNGMTYILQPFVFAYYVRRHYPSDRNAQADEKLLGERWNGISITVASFIHNNADIALLTVFSGLKAVSVYSVYALVMNGMKFFILTITRAVEPVIGHAYAAGDSKVLEFKLRLYEYIVSFLVCLIFGVGSLLLVPFVKIYTGGISDADYILPVFGMLLLVAEALYLIKIPHLVLAYAAGKFREIKKHAYLEAGCNLILSLLLVKPFGLAGVAAGTAAAMLYRLIFHVRYTGVLIKGRKQRIFYGTVFRFAAVTAAGLAICRVFAPFRGNTFREWAMYGFLYSGIMVLLYAALSVTAFRNELHFLKGYLLSGKAGKYDT